MDTLTLQTTLGNSTSSTFDAMLEGRYSYSGPDEMENEGSLAPPHHEWWKEAGSGPVFAAVSGISGRWSEEPQTPLETARPWSPTGVVTAAYTNACTAATYAAIAASHAVSHGVDHAFAITCRDIDRETHALFSTARAVSPTGRLRPLMADRDGLMLGRAACILGFRRARVRSGDVSIAGYGISTDAVDDVKPDPSGLGMAAAISASMDMAGISGADLAFISPHATGTPSNDPAELAAYRHALGHQSSELMFFPSKANLGHSLEATGMVEIALCAEVLRTSTIPPVPFADGEPLHSALLARTKSSIGNARYCLSVNAAFGGSNVAVVLRLH